MTPAASPVLQPATTGPLTTRPCTVTAVRVQTHDVATLDLDLDLDPDPDRAAGASPASGPGRRDGAAAMAVAAGQFVMAYAHGVGEAPISVSSDPGTSTRLSLTIRRVGAVTDALLSAGPGATVGVRGPYGRPWPVRDAEGGDLLVVAGGIGLAPVRPAVAQALATRASFRRLLVVVGARSPQDLVFRDELDRWAADPAVDLAVTVDTATRRWRGEVGLVTRPLGRTELDPARTTALICGPEPMMRGAAQVLLDAGVPAGQVHVTLERTMRCGVGTCGHCQLGPLLVCRDGPVLAWPEVARLLEVREL